MQNHFYQEGVNVGRGYDFGEMRWCQAFLLGVKKPDDVMRMMAAGGPLTPDDTCKVAKRKRKEKDCTERIGSHSSWSTFTFLRYCNI
jgi:hypothetical protein